MLKTTSCWTEELSEADSLRVLEDLGTYHANQGGLHGWVIACMIKEHDYAGLCSYVLPQDEENWDILQLIHCRQALAFFTKYEPLPLGINKEEAAFESYIASERLCAETNALFRAFVGNKLSLPSSFVRRLLAARAKIARVLGNAPCVSELTLRFGPGSTTSITKTSATWQAKLAEMPTCSEELLRSPYFSDLVRALPHWLDCHEAGEVYHEDEKDGDYCYIASLVNVAVSPGRLEFVAKNAKTFRSIDIQPTMNTMLQGGIGRHMRDRLALVGINIRDQSMNQRMARKGSMDNSLCTLDLSSASDTVSTGLVRYLLPDDWFALLRAASCGTTEFRGEIRTLEKFSSMGNGFTFPLETLIFWALTASACEGNVERVRAYGDDIICPRENVVDVVKLLVQCGFIINNKKSYLDGPFRESCGADYYRGINVRPGFYAEKRLAAEDLFLIHNFYVRSFQPEMACVVEGWIAEPLRIYGPDGYGDGHLLSSSWPRIRSRASRRRGFGGYSFETFRHIGCFTPNRYPGDYVTPLYATYCKEEGEDRLANDEHNWSETCVEEPVALLWAHQGYRTKIVEWAKRVSPPSQKFLGIKKADNDHDWYRPLWSRPGTNGYERALIYTFVGN